MPIFYIFPCDTAYLLWQAKLAISQHRGLPLPGRWDILLGRSSELLAIMSGGGGVPVGKMGVTPAHPSPLGWLLFCVSIGELY